MPPYHRCRYRFRCSLLGLVGLLLAVGQLMRRILGNIISSRRYFTAPDGSRGSLPAYQIKIGMLDSIPATEIPLPSTLALLGGALFGVGLQRRRRR